MTTNPNPTTYENLSPEEQKEVDDAIAKVKGRAFWSKFTVGNIVSDICAVLFTVAAWPWSGYVTSTVWSWFAVGQFGLRPLSTLQAMAAGMLVACFSWSFVREPQLFKLLSPEASRLQRKWFTVVYVWLTPATLLFWAWLLKKFL